MATRITTERTEIEWRAGATATADGHAIVERFGEYRGSGIGVFCDAGGAWSFEVRRRQHVDPAFGGTYASLASDEADAYAAACDYIDEFEKAEEAAGRPAVGTRFGAFGATTESGS